MPIRIEQLLEQLLERQMRVSNEFIKSLDSGMVIQYNRYNEPTRHKEKRNERNHQNHSPERNCKTRAPERNARRQTLQFYSTFIGSSEIRTTDETK